MYPGTARARTPGVVKSISQAFLAKGPGSWRPPARQEGASLKRSETQPPRSRRGKIGLIVPLSGASISLALFRWRNEVKVRCLNNMALLDSKWRAQPWQRQCDTSENGAGSPRMFPKWSATAPTPPRLLPLKDPAELGWHPVVRIDHYQLGARSIELAREEQ